MTPFIIYARAVGIYCLLTLPAITLPIMYLVSVTYVLIYRLVCLGTVYDYLFHHRFLQSKFPFKNVHSFCGSGYRCRNVLSNA